MTDPTDTAPRCAAQTTGGRACRAYARPNHATCFTHGTDVPQGVKTAGRSRGGKGANLAHGTTPDLSALAERLGGANSVDEIAGVLAEVAGLVLVGAIPPRIGSVVAQLASAQMKLLEKGLNEQLKRLQQKLDDPRFIELRRVWDATGTSRPQPNRQDSEATPCR